MANLNGRARQENTYDAIVVGSGISGGWAAKELAAGGRMDGIANRADKTPRTNTCRQRAFDQARQGRATLARQLG